MIKSKLIQLQGIVRELKSVLVAFSGGVDSTFLLNVAKDVLKDNAIAVTIDSPVIPEDELKRAKTIASGFSIEHIVIKINQLTNREFVNNTKERCYFCKKELFTRLKRIAREKGLQYVIDGSNYDDLGDYRPGHHALKELAIRSPLLEAKLTKKEIRTFSKAMGLFTWHQPAYACLASRVPYGTRISKDILRKIERAEEVLRSFGFKQIRVRHYGHTARIEIKEEEMPFLFDRDVRKALVAKLHALGYLYITLDLEGYKAGSLNKVLKASAR